MNVLVVMRVYSGLADSLAGGEWQPRGVPAVYRLLEGLAARQDIRTSYIFLARDPDPRFERTLRSSIAALGGDVTVLPWRRWPLVGRRIGNALREAEQALCVLWIAARSRAQVSYCTNAAYISASLIARLRIAPVVMRFLGIFPVHKQMAERRGHAVARWFYRAPFARAVCTLEGSGAEYYLPKLLAEDVPCDVLLNGVDRPSADPAAVAALRARLSPQGLPIIAFLGRLESSKGCDDFVDGLIRLQALRPGGFIGLVVGDGAMRPQIERKLAAAGLAGQVHLAGAVPHREVANYLGASDIYVSLNRFGNLSNANLEALMSGRCTLMLESDPAGHIDEVTDRMVPAFVVERVSRNATAESLAVTLARLIDDPAEIRRRAEAASGLAATLVTDWPSRVSREIATILEAGGAAPSSTNEQAATAR